MTYDQGYFLGSYVDGKDIGETLTGKEHNGAKNGFVRISGSPDQHA